MSINDIVIRRDLKEAIYDHLMTAAKSRASHIESFLEKHKQIMELWANLHMGDDMTKLNTPMDILKAALKKEKASYRFYDDLLKEHKSVEILRGTIGQLREEEYRHIQIIEKKITKLGLG